MTTQTIEQAVEEFGNQFDELNMKSPKNSMPGLERELLKDFMRKALQVQRDAGEVRLKTFAENVIEVDKTERYEYSKNDCDRNAKGELAGSGARWSTPKEMAQRILQALTPPTK